MLSIIIPTYNEKKNIEKLLQRLQQQAKSWKERYEIVVVDDGSPDGTADLVQKLDGIRLIKRKERGLATAIWAGACAAQGNTIVVMDADLSHPPEKVAQLVAALVHADLVIASRHLPGGGVEDWPWHRKLVSDGATLLSRLVVHQPVTDSMSGFFAVRKSILLQTPLKVKGYKILMNVLAKNPGIRIREIPYVFRNRKQGKSKLGGKEIFVFVQDLLRLL